MVCKDEVVDWFHKLNGAGRLDVMCTLLDECLPFELRFLGTVMENLGRRDFHELRDVDHRANTFLHPNPSSAEVSDKMALCSALMDSSHQQQLSSPSVANVHPLSFTGPSAAFNNASDDFHQKVPENTIPSSRPSSVQHADKVRSSGNSGGSPQSQQPNMVSEGLFIGGRRQGDGCSDSGMKATTLNLPVNSSNENADEKSDKSILLDDIVRRRLILYLSLLTATNRECANVYYKVLSEVEPLLETSGWLDLVEGHMLEEMALLYTIASNHPAFTFKQRSAMNDVCNKFCNQQSKLETPKVFTQATQSFIATAVHGFDPKFGQYYIHYVPHPVQAMQWQSPNGTGNIIGGSNGTAEEANRLQSPVTFTMPPYHAFPTMYMPTHTHLPRSQAPPIHHTQVQVPHQFSQNLPVQTAVSPQAAQLGIASQPPPHPSQTVPHSFQQNPQVQGSTASHNQIHSQAPSHIPHSYSPNMNGPVQNILPVSGGIHAQMQPLGLSNPPTISSAVPQYQPKAQNVSQLSPQLPSQGPPRNSLVVGGTNMTAAFPCQSNSLDGNESEELCWDSTESSPFQSPPQSLTPSRSQSPTPMNNQVHVINQNPNYANVQPVVSHLRSQEVNSHSNNAAPVAASSTAFSSTSSQRSVCSSTTSISPPPRSQKTSSSQKHSQNIQVQTRILPKNAQDVELNTTGLNNVNVPYSSVPVSTPSANVSKSNNCVVSANNLNGFKSSVSDRDRDRDRRSMSNSKVSVANLMNNCNLNSSSNVSTSQTVSHSQSQGVMQPVVAVVSSANYSLPAPHLVPASSSSIQQQQHQQHQQHQQQQHQQHQQQHQQSQQHQPQPQRETNRRQPQLNRRQPANNSASHQQSHHTPSSVSNHYSLHSQPMKNTNIASTAHNLSQYGFTFPFTVPSYPPQTHPPSIPPNKGTNTVPHFTNPNSKQQISSQQTVVGTNNQSGGKVSNNDIPVVFTGHPQPPSNTNSHNHNGIKLSTHDSAPTFNVPTAAALSSNLTIINSAPTSVLQHPAPAALHPSQTSRNRVLLEVGGGQDVGGIGRIDGIQFLEDLADDSSRSKTSCYNCGAQTHVGPECKENTMEEMTKHPYRINFHPETSSQETKDTE